MKYFAQGILKKNKYLKSQVLQKTEKIRPLYFQIVSHRILKYYKTPLWYDK